MKTLRLPLKRKWFEMTALGIKTEDYRELTPYWCGKFLMWNGEKQSREWWENMFFKGYEGNCGVMVKRFFKKSPFIYDSDLCINAITQREFDTNKITLGYPKATDNSRILNFEHKGIEIRTGNPEWGAEPDKIYFVIKHGRLLIDND